MSEIQMKIEELSKLKACLVETKCKLLATILKQKIQDIGDHLSDEIAEKNFQKISDQLSNITLGQGVFSQTGFWKIKSKICPKDTDPPLAKRDEHGNLITSPGNLKQLYLETYTHRLRHRSMVSNHSDIFILKSELWKRRFGYLKEKVTNPWSPSQFEKAIKSLKNNQARDPMGIINELFKTGLAGEQLKISTLNLMNQVKLTMKIPRNMQLSNITSIWKKKGSQLDMANDRGIFVLTAVRKILDKLTYLDKYPDIEMSMSGSNIGARRNKNIRDHLFIIHGVINSVVQGEDSCIDIQVYDLEQAFDALWLEDTLNDLYDYLPDNARDDKLALVYQTNTTNLVAVNTAAGQTARVNIPTIVQQGSGWGPLQCSVTMDKIGKIAKERGIHQYVYKGMVRILPLACVDDLLGFAQCGIKSIALNTFINTHIEMKKLKFHTPSITGKSKCYKLHIGKKNKHCPELRVHGHPMKIVQSEKYLGDFITDTGSNTETIKHRVSIGNGIVAKIKSILENMYLGEHYFKIAFLLRESLFLNGILYSAEAWYGVKDSEISELEKIDNILLRSIFEVPRSTPVVSLYLESGCVRIRNILKARRINFLHHLVNLDKEEMQYKFFKAQWDHPCPQDWTLQVKNDMMDVGLPTSLEFVESKSKNVFKDLVKSRVKSFEFANLMESRRSKTENLKYQTFKMQEYLNLKTMTKNEAIILFKFRTRMAPFGENFRNGKSSTNCPLCLSHVDAQEKSFSCPTLKRLISIKGNYEDIFSNKIPYELIRTLYDIYTYRKEGQE